MNIILFAAAETLLPLPLDDARARHILGVLQRRAGESFDAGLIDGPRGRATVEAVDADGLRLRFEWGEASLPLEPVTLIIGLPRPQTARKLLEDATALGVEAMHFVTSERGEPGYARSGLWSDEWRRHVIAGAQQAFSTRLPAVTWTGTLGDAVANLASGGSRFALDNYESPVALGVSRVTEPAVIAVGPERGWSPGERELLRAAGFHFVHLGERVLRVETACVAAIALVRANLGRM